MKAIAPINDALTATHTLRISQSQTECYATAYAAINREAGGGQFVLELVVHDETTSKHFSIY